jgi:hypothetical protein
LSISVDDHHGLRRPRDRWRNKSHRPIALKPFYLSDIENQASFSAKLPVQRNSHRGYKIVMISRLTGYGNKRRLTFQSGHVDTVKQRDEDLGSRETRRNNNGNCCCVR